MNFARGRIVRRLLGGSRVCVRICVSVGGIFVFCEGLLRLGKEALD